MKIETKIIITRDIIFKRIVVKIVKGNILILRIIEILEFGFGNSLETSLLLRNIYFAKGVTVQRKENFFPKIIIK